jgi:uncharacterized coiled-coil DUF342 family protein
MVHVRRGWAVHMSKSNPDELKNKVRELRARLEALVAKQSEVLGTAVSQGMNQAETDQYDERRRIISELTERLHRIESSPGMQDEKAIRWLKLCEQVTTEENPEKQLQLVKEANDLLEHTERRAS